MTQASPESATATVSTRRADEWISKTDLSRYYRCPYAYSLLCRGEIRLQDMVDGFTVLLMQEGAAFHESVIAAEVAAGAEATPVQVFENSGLRIFGVPDGIRNDRASAARSRGDGANRNQMAQSGSSAG
jgi:hypothetical protein